MDGIARRRAKAPVDLAVVESAIAQQFLQPDAIRRGQRSEIRWPWRADGGAPGDAFAEQRDRHRVGIRVVVLLDDPVVVPEQERWAIGARGQIERRLSRGGQGGAIGATKSMRGEARECSRQRPPVEPGRNLGFIAPDLARGPPLRAQEMRDRGERILR